MRFYGMALVASAFVLAACGGGDNQATDTAAPAASTDTAAAAGAAPATAGTPAPITGQTHTVKMVGDDKGYRFEPAELTIKAGDGVKWEMVSGGPHNVAFDQAAVGAAASALMANMPNQQSPLSSPYFMNAGESYTISFANVPAGKYEYVCTPHLAMNMKGTLTIQ